MKRAAQLIQRMEKDGAPAYNGGSHHRYRHRGGKGSAQKDSNGEFTHFLAYPIWNNYTEAVKKVQEQFKQFVKDNYPMHQKDYNFQSHKCVHLTILMLYLHTDEQKELAKKAIKAAEPQIRELTKGPLKVRLTVVETFSDGAGRVYYLGLDPKYGDYLKFMQVEDILIRNCQQLGLAPTKLGGKQCLQNTKFSETGPTLYHTEPHATFLRLANYGKDKNLASNIFPKLVSKFNEAFLPDGFGEIVIDLVDICTRFDFNPLGQYNYLDRLSL